MVSIRILYMPYQIMICMTNNLGKSVDALKTFKVLHVLKKKNMIILTSRSTNQKTKHHSMDKGYPIYFQLHHYQPIRRNVCLLYLMRHAEKRLNNGGFM